MKFPKVPATSPEAWEYVLKYFIEKGLVFRLVGPTVQHWVPGIMDKKGTKWVWKKTSIAKLKADRGISLTCKVRHDIEAPYKVLVGLK